jgi:hypothetical protein
MYNDSTSFVLTAIGADAADPRCVSPALEGIEFDAATSTFALREITFDGAGAPRLSAKNPETCLGCHGSDPRPLMDPYFVWPGFYGSNDDNYLTQDRLRDGDALPPESESYFKFVDSISQTDVYSQLIWTARRQVPRSSRPGKNISVDPYERPNAFFGLYASLLNQRRLARLATGFAGWDRYKYPLAYAAKCVKNGEAPTLDRWIPAQMLAARPVELPTADFDRYAKLWDEGGRVPPAELAKLSRLNKGQISLVESVLDRSASGVSLGYWHKYQDLSPVPAMHAPHAYRPLGDLADVVGQDVVSLPLHLIAYLYQWAGVSMDEWAMPLEGGLLLVDGDDDAQSILAKVYRAALPEYATISCDDLAQKSLAALSQVAQ